MTSLGFENVLSFNRKRPKTLFKSYKLMSLVSTSPEELFSRKIDSEEYGEALIMAQHYGLDSDQVNFNFALLVI